MGIESSIGRGRNDGEWVDAFECCDGQSASASEVVAVGICCALEKAVYPQTAQLSRQFAGPHVGQKVGEIA